MTEKKKFYQSKVFWINLVTLVVTIATGVLGLDFIPKKVVDYLLPIVSLGNLVLRFGTDTKLTFGDDK